ncbi:hypothetical protein A3D72_03310 [Candidatus Uhrbacteria bacterium RIFCSPHIGHO2_02_FULL_57_19]|uniref:EamA domain-containing protein n=1 Tax=Candidatus Uhrbacteria bacterium RIFCSPHIGHO2_02_FULL_57_19 TaxID=1802391 RepID=A0A1F7U7Y8_9BACT|nr:MAG: hypothetical protein A3D72_03310 [Candidatus Uhrbacteria bacterium RIFCSPHIGHO2_02_FULL_57_19]
MPILRLAAVALAPFLALASGLAPAVAPSAVIPILMTVGPLLAVFFAMVIGAGLRRVENWYLLLLPLFFWISAMLAVLLAERPGFRNAVGLLAAFLIGLNILILFNYFYLPLRYQPYSLASISQAMGIATLFFVGINLSALVTFLSLPLWTGVVMAFGLGGFISAHNFWTGKVPAGRALPMIVAAAILTAETFWAAALLPVSSPVVGALLALSVYLTTGLARHVYLETVSRRVALRYSLITMVGAALVLGTARWV